MAGNVVRPLRTILTALLWPVNAGKFHKLLRVLSLSTPLKTQRSLNLGCVHMPFTTSLLCNSLKEIGATDQIFDRAVQWLSDSACMVARWNSPSDRFAGTVGARRTWAALYQS